MLLSILVISRSQDLLIQMLNSISKATSLGVDKIEILCSWNGSRINEKKIINNTIYNFNIVQRDKYHFAKNINSLSRKALGQILLIINDDIILDPNSIDNAIDHIKNQKNVGLIAGNLRYEDGLIQHIGISFDKYNNPYHKFEKSIKSNSWIIDYDSKCIPAATGALIFIKKELFDEIGFCEKYEVCGEDIELSLDIREKKDLNILFCPKVSGIHFSSKTRKKHNQFGNTINDIKRMQKRRLKFIQNVSKDQLLLELKDLQEENYILKKISIKNRLKIFIKRFLKRINLKIN